MIRHFQNGLLRTPLTHSMNKRIVSTIIVRTPLTHSMNKRIVSTITEPIHTGSFGLLLMFLQIQVIIIKTRAQTKRQDETARQ
jgi:hypothetical protein